MLRITDSGRRLLAEKSEPIGRDLGRLYDVVGEEDVEAVRRFLLRLIERFENYPHDNDEEAEGDGA
jgi:DNA-binding MarR family transcriptional regulator